MPIILDDAISSSLVTKSYDQTFFDKSLTGKTGRILGTEKNPANISVDTKPNHSVVNTRYAAQSNYVDVLGHKVRDHDTFIPLHWLSDSLEHELYQGSWRCLRTGTRMLNLDRYVHAATDATGSTDLWLRLEPYVITIEERHYPGNHNNIQVSKNSSVTWRIDAVVAASDQTSSDVERACVHARETARSNQLSTLVPSFNDTVRQVALAPIYTMNPMAATRDIVSSVSADGFSVDGVKLERYIDSISLYDEVCELSRVWQTEIHDRFRALMDDMRAIDPNFPDSRMCRAIVHDVVERLEAYGSVPLDSYHAIYETLSDAYPAKTVRNICKHNLNLLLSDTMRSLADVKDSLNRVEPPAGVTPTISKIVNNGQAYSYSDEQIAAIGSPGPCTMVQSGAGTGKSTVILGRIEYMIACGINPADITVLSFTNAAADHIEAMRPGINSHTIAHMVDTIYSHNFPKHHLSSVATIVSSLSAFCHDNPLRQPLTDRLKDVESNKTGAFSALNQFVEDHLNEVLEMLDAVEQTTLELEIVLCYQLVNSLQEPPGMSNAHLIIDEVQDNAIFEFIYTLRYVAKNHASIYIVGDSSQTLFEFRASNPRALNSLENSGVFDCHKLQTNYRSNQEILDFANVYLANIEANQYAKLQLRANDLTPVTESSFRDRVKVAFHRARSQRDMREHVMPNGMMSDVTDFINKCMARGEQVAILCYANKDVQRFQEMVTKAYPQLFCVNISPAKSYDSDVLSRVCAEYWSEVSQCDPTKVFDGVFTIVKNNMHRFTYSAKAEAAILACVDKWRLEQRSTVMAWANAQKSGRITHDEFLKRLRKNMIQHEIHHNSIRQSVISARNNDRRHSQDALHANVLFSTIHSAKGLEFDNTIVLYDEGNKDREDFKRIYYVALTRAIHSELVLAYGNKVHKNSSTVQVYDSLCERYADMDAERVANATVSHGADGVNVVVDFGENATNETDKVDATETVDETDAVAVG